MNEDEMRKQWQCPINCKEKREPKDSFDILQIKINNPGITHGEIAREYGYDYNRIKHLSHAYFHSSRVDAFMREELRQVVPSIVQGVNKVLRSYCYRVDSERGIFSDHTVIVEQLQRGIIEKLNAGEQPTREEFVAYGVQLDRLNKNALQEARVVSELAKALEFFNGSDVLDNSQGMSEGARAFVRAIESMRESR